MNSDENPMKVIQSPLFARKLKKLHKNEKKELDIQIRKIMNDPESQRGRGGFTPV